MEFNYPITYLKCQSCDAKNHCRQCAERAVTYMEEYARAGYQVVAILSCDGSPTCGVTITSYDTNWGGSPVELSYNDAIVQGKGVYIEELEQAIRDRGLEVPPFYGLALDDESVDLDRIIKDFRAFIQSVCG